jgi:hypothetical protein
MKTQNAEISALRTLRSGFFFLVRIIMFITAAEAGYLLSVYLFDALIEPAGIMGALIVFGLLLLVSLDISLYAIFGKIRPGIRQLSQIGSRFLICFIGTLLITAGILIVMSGLFVGAITDEVEKRPDMIVAALEGYIIQALKVIIIGSIIGLIVCIILTLVLGAFRLHSRYQNSLYMAAGILYVVGMPLMFFGLGGIHTAVDGISLYTALVGNILMYIALGNTINKLSTAAPIPVQT